MDFVGQIKRLFAVAPMIFILGCTGGPLAYQKPLTTAPPETSVLLAKNSKAAVFKAAQQVLVSEGYQITNANEAAGVISTAYRNLKVTPEQADCGSLWGTPLSRRHTHYDEGCLRRSHHRG